MFYLFVHLFLAQFNREAQAEDIGESEAGEDGRDGMGTASLLENSQGGGFPCSVVTEECRDLALIESDGKAVHSGPTTGLENLYQALHAHSRHQPWKFAFEEGVLEGKAHCRKATL